LMTSCQVSEYWKSGPVSAQISTILRAPINTGVEPEYLVVFSAKRPKKEALLAGGAGADIFFSEKSSMLKGS